VVQVYFYEQVRRLIIEVWSHLRYTKVLIEGHQKIYKDRPRVGQKGNFTLTPLPSIIQFDLIDNFQNLYINRRGVFFPAP
jgi:hypothetical protein